jgi:hypothetical protein
VVVLLSFTYQNQDQPECPAPAQILRDKSTNYRANDLPNIKIQPIAFEQEEDTDRTKKGTQGKQCQSLSTLVGGVDVCDSTTTNRIWD